MHRLLITGASGFVGGNLVRVASRTWDVVGLFHAHRPEFDGARWLRADLADRDAVARVVDESAPDAVIHLAAISNIDRCEKERETAYRANVLASANIAEACAGRGCRLISISTDNVFDGKRGDYGEDDPPNPVNYYGRTKVLAEEEVLERAAGALVVRIPLMLGFPVTPAGSFLHGVVKSLREGARVTFFTDEFRTPCDVFTLCDALLELARRSESGRLHIGGAERVSRADIGRMFLRRLGLNDDAAAYASAAEVMKGRAPRPPDVSFDVARARAALATPLLGLERSMDRIWSLTDREALRVT